jgi:hypothetical protein
MTDNITVSSPKEMIHKQGKNREMIRLMMRAARLGSRSRSVKRALYTVLPDLENTVCNADFQDSDAL